MEPARILSATTSRTMRRHIKRSLSAAGLEVEHCRVEWPAIENALARSPCMCIIDVNGDVDEVDTIVGKLNEDHQDVIPLLISRDHEMPFIRERLLKSNLNNLIAKHGALTTHAVIDENELIVTCQKLLKHDIFGLEKYLHNWNVPIYERTILSTDEKDNAVVELDDYLDLIDCHRSIKDSVLLVADELLMNGIFNAPRDPQGRAKYGKLNRSQPLTLEPDEEVVFRYTCDGRNIALSVTDRFGSLHRDVIRHYIRDGMDDDRQPRPKEGGGGAGLGLHMVFNSITQLTFNIRQGSSTEAIALFYARSGALAFRSSGRSLNLFFQAA